MEHSSRQMFPEIDNSGLSWDEKDGKDEEDWGRDEGDWAKEEEGGRWGSSESGSREDKSDEDRDGDHHGGSSHGGNHPRQPPYYQNRK